MLKTYKYRLYPTKKQTTFMSQILNECRWLYNYFLEQRKTFWKEEKESLSYYSQAIFLPSLKKERSSLNDVYSQVLQNVAVRVDLAFKAFFRRVKAGEKPGYPRFRGKERYDSFTFPQSGFKIKDGFLKVFKIGKIKMKYHRSIEGVIHTCTIRKSPTNKWFVFFSCEVIATPLPKCKKIIGIDMGLISFATFSNGEKITNPRFFIKEEKLLAKAQRNLSKQSKKTPKKAKAKKVVSRIYERISNKRHNFVHQQSKEIINRFGIICIEDLSINKMVHNSCLSKSIMDAAWFMFAQSLSYKAEYAGRNLVKVNPAYTSQDCSRCGHRQTKNLSDRIHKCSCCDLKICRDHNAALNIMRLGIQSQGISPRSSVI